MGRFALLVLAASLALAQPARAAARPWTIDFFDVGQGDSSLLRLPDGSNVLIDGGVPEMGDRLVKDLHDRGVQRLDMVIMTHPHADHVGGLHRVFQEFPVRLALDAGMSAPSRAYRDVLKDMTTKGVSLQLGRPGMHKTYGPVTLDVLAPAEPLLKNTRSDINNASIVTRWQDGKVALLETGDAEQEALDRLLKSGQNLQAQILKVAHHGSRYTSSQAFLDAVKPEVAVISAGAHNDYHHPHRAALERLAKAGAKVYVTDQEGTVTVTSDGKTYQVASERPYEAPVAGDPPKAKKARKRKGG